MKPEKITSYLSDCCKAATKVEGIADFPGSKDICTVSFSCTKCSKPCDIYISAEKKKKIEELALKKKIEQILDNMLARFLPRPSPRFEKYVRTLLDDRDRACKEIMEAIKK